MFGRVTGIDYDKSRECCEAALDRVGLRAKDLVDPQTGTLERALEEIPLTPDSGVYEDVAWLHAIALDRLHAVSHDAAQFGAIQYALLPGIEDWMYTLSDDRAYEIAVILEQILVRVCETHHVCSMAMLGTIMLLTREGLVVPRIKVLLQDCRYGYKELVETCSISTKMGPVSVSIADWELEWFRAEFGDPARVILEPVIALLCASEYYDYVADRTPWYVRTEDCESYPYAHHIIRDLKDIVARLNRDTRCRILEQLLS